MKQLNIILINYKTPKLTISCVESLLPEIDFNCDHIVIVDNNSNDESVSYIKDWITNKKLNDIVQMVESKINGGFSYGCNLGAGSVKSEYLLFINSDALATQGAVGNMLSVIKSNKQTGLMSPVILNEYGTPENSRFYNKTPANEFLRAAGTGFFTKIFNYLGVYEVAQYRSSSDEKPEWVSFACVLLRTEMYNQVGPLDEGFFMYSEDNDYCRRLKSADWEIGITSKAQIIHLNKGLSASRRERMPYFFYASRTRYFMKYYGYIGLLMANLFWTLGFMIRSIRFLFGKGVPYQHKFAFFDIWANFMNPMTTSNKSIRK